MSSEKSPYESKFWLKSYDDFVPENVDIELISLAEMLRRSVKEFPEVIVYEYMGTTSTYQEYEKDVITFANFLIQNGLKKGDCVSIHLPNTPQLALSSQCFS